LNTATGSTVDFVSADGERRTAELSFHQYSPDGRYILLSTRDVDPSGSRDLYIADASGRILRQLMGPDGELVRNAYWSPDGQHMIIDTFILPGPLSPPSGPVRTPVPVTGQAAATLAPARVAPSLMTPQVPDFRVYMADADGTNMRRIADQETRYLRWSPDSSALFFLGGRSWLNELYVMTDLDNPHSVPRLVRSDMRDYYRSPPVWRP
jgi:Tol biopolymer transport system component